MNFSKYIEQIITYCGTIPLIEDFSLNYFDIVRFSCQLDILQKLTCLKCYNIDKKQKRIESEKHNRKYTIIKTSISL